MFETRKTSYFNWSENTNCEDVVSSVWKEIENKNVVGIKQVLSEIKRRYGVPEFFSIHLSAHDPVSWNISLSTEERHVGLDINGFSGKVKQVYD